MAGGQMSPRQKMINLMYLVLIAMLALNVDTAVLEKFVLINQSFEATNAEKVTDNINKVEAIRAAVDDSGNRSEDIKVLEKAEQVRADARSLLVYMNQVKDSIANMTGGKDSNGKYKGYTDTDAISRFMVKLGNGDTLKIRLNKYSSFIAEEIFEDTSSVHNLARDASEIDIYRDDESFGHLPFKELNFGYNTPMVGGLASISQLQSDLINLEIKALEKLAASVGAADLKFDVVSLTTLPEQKVVAAGAKYKTQIFLSAASSAIIPIMTADGDTLDVTNGRGYYEFTAKGGRYDREGLSQQSYIGAISVTLPGGKDTTFVDTIDYYVARPVIQIQSASVQALYLNCGNEIQVQVPALGSDYNPSFTVNGGDLVRGSGTGEITIIPNTSKVDLNVSNAGNFLGTKSFGVRKIPAPEIQARIKGKQIDSKRGIPVNTASFSLDAIPDESFAAFLPKDARFQVREAEINLVRAGRGVSRVRATSKNINLSKLAGKRKGDNIVIEIKQVARANFRGDVENFRNFVPRVITIPLN